MSEELTGRRPQPPARDDRHTLPARGRPPKAPAPVAELVEELTHQLHDDPKNVRSNTTRATRLWKDSGLPADKFYARLLEARSITRQQSTVAKKSATDKHQLNRMPYFFAVVEDLVGLKDSTSDRSQHRAVGP